MRVKKDEEISSNKIIKYHEKKLVNNQKDYASRVRSLERELDNERKTIRVYESAEERLLGKLHETQKK